MGFSVIVQRTHEQNRIVLATDSHSAGIGEMGDFENSPEIMLSQKQPRDAVSAAPNPKRSPDTVN